VLEGAGAAELMEGLKRKQQQQQQRCKRLGKMEKEKAPLKAKRRKKEEEEAAIYSSSTDTLMTQVKQVQTVAWGRNIYIYCIYIILLLIFYFLGWPRWDSNPKP